jgi:cysteinyl-tRNA synthetase
MNRKKILGMSLVLVGLFVSGLTASCQSQANSKAVQDPKNYKTAMVDLIADLHQYSQQKTPGFELITNGGADLFQQDEENPAKNVDKLVDSLSGALVESVYYGWDMDDNSTTPARETRHFEQVLSVPQERGLPILNMDYCYSKKRMESSYEKNDAKKYIGFAAPRRELDRVPREAVHHENTADCRSLKNVSNFMALLNPGDYHSKDAYLADLRNTNYDLLIIDLYFDDEPLSKADIQSLKVKKNGGMRLVYAYMSVGEAEDYRAYWQKSWEKQRPDWIADLNEDWKGNYKVKYWRQEWRNLLFGNPDAYLDKILAAGFDGSFLDVIDAYEYFEAKQGK